MKNDYMIKRIFIGVAIGTILMFIRSCEVKAQAITLEITPYNYCYNYYASTRTRGNFTSGNTNLFRYGGDWNYCLVSSPPSDDVLYQDLVFYPRETSGGSPLTQNVAYTYTFNFYSGVDLNIDKFEIQYNYLGDNFRQSCVTTPTGNVYESYFTVVCENVKVNSFNNLIHLYSYISNNNAVNQAYLFLDRIVSVEEFKDTNDIITDSNVENPGFNGGGVSFEPPGYEGVIGNLFTMPLEFYNILNNRLIDNCEPLFISKSNLPFSSFGVWDSVENGLTIQCMRTYIEDSNYLNFGYYETIGTIVGVLLIGKVLLKKGRALMSMGELSATDEECWGGLN